MPATGSTTSGDVLSMSPMLMEKYISAAQEVSKVAVFGESYLTKPTKLVELLPKKFQDDTAATGNVKPFSYRGTAYGSFHVPVDAEYEFRFRYANYRGANADVTQADAGAPGAAPAGAGRGRGRGAAGAPAGAPGTPGAAPGAAPDPAAPAAAGRGRGAGAAAGGAAARVLDGRRRGWRATRGADGRRNQGP